MRHTNINLKGDNKVFKYIVEYNDTDEFWELDDNKTNPDMQYVRKYERIDIINNLYDYVKFSSNWINKNSHIDNIQASYDKVVEENLNVMGQIIPITNQYLPNRIKIADINIYYPLFSIDTYQSTSYILTINTWINGKNIYLGSYVLNRIDALAASKIKTFEDNRYYEFSNIKIIDPYEMIYDDSWKEFRHKVCGEPLIEGEYNYNNTGSLLNFTLYPVDYINDSYISKEFYSGGQNSINIVKNVNDIFNISINPEFEDRGMVIKYDINFNKTYVNDLNLYLRETYGILNPTYSCKLIIIDKSNYSQEYFSTSPQIYEDNIESSIVFDKYVFNDGKDKYEEGHFNLFDSWDNWRPGLVIVGVLTIYYTGDDRRDDLLSISSNEIPLTKDLYKYLKIDDFKTSHINLNDIDMKQYNISVVNKIVNNIIQVDKPEDSKANIIQPVFFRVRDLNSIIIHPEVTENICINLDSYKSKVNKFTLQVEGVKFNQISSTSQGIIFRVIGNNLPNSKPEGVYYILDDNYDMITSGKYIYEQ